MFDNLTERFAGIFNRLRSKGRLSEDDVDAALREVRLALLEADVNVKVTKEFLDRVRARSVGSEVTESLTPGQQVVKIVQEELVTTLGEAPVPLASGSLGNRLDVPVFSDRTAKAPKLVKDALKQARAQKFDSVIIDTAGRLQIDLDLMAELATVRKAADPDEVLLVVDAMTGQDAVNVATGFLEHADLTGLVFSKLDGDARGGAAISARAVTGLPIKFAGVGEGTGDLEVFHPERMASRILGMGDVMTLIEKAEATWDEQQAVEAAEKLRTASFTLEDFLDQFQQIRRMGDVGQLVGMLPGASALKQADVSDADLARVEAIIRSMTPAERRDPKAIDGSRRRRIAAGSGTTPQDVNGLLRQFAETQKLMKAFAEGRSPIPGLAMPGRRRKRKR